MPRACAAAERVPAAPFGDPITVESGVPKYPQLRVVGMNAPIGPQVSATHTMVQ